MMNEGSEFQTDGAQSWWMVRWTVKCQMNVMFALFPEGWCY